MTRLDVEYIKIDYSSKNIEKPRNCTSIFTKLNYINGNYMNFSNFFLDNIILGVEVFI